MRMESEKPDRTQVYRLWTSKNYQQYLINVSSGNSQQVPRRNRHSTKFNDLVPCDQSSQTVPLLDSSFQEKDALLQERKTHSAQTDFGLPHTCNGLTTDTQVTVHCMVPQNLTDEFLVSGNDAMLGATMTAADSSVPASESTQSVPLEHPLSVSSSPLKQTQWYRSVGSTVLGARRVQWILKRLEVYSTALSYLQCLVIS